MSSPLPSPAVRDDRRIRRVARACTNCRRKKAKCSGEQPICRNCLRLSQPCHYRDNLASRRRGSPDESRHGSEDADESQSRKYNDHLTTRITVVEEKLDELINTMHRFLPLLQNQAASPLSSSEGRGPGTSPSSFNAGQHIDGLQSFQPIQPEKTYIGELPPLEVTMSLINLYFSRVHNQPYSLFHEQHFRQRFASGLVPNYLIFAMIASSLRFSTHDYYQSRQKEAIMSYASSSWSHIVRVWFAAESDPDLQICQAVTLLSIIDFTAGRKHPGWMKVGLSIRLAQDLRLMLEPNSELSCVEQEEQRRVFWSIYVLDKLCSCGRARPAALLDPLCHVQLPGHESDFQDGKFRKMPTLRQALSSVEHHNERMSNAALVVLVASIIGKCAQHMIHEHGRAEGCLPPWDSKSDFAMIHSTLLQLETQFQIGGSIEEALLAQHCYSTEGYDMQIAGPIMFSYALFYTAQCLLHHPFLLYQQSKSRGTKPPASFISRALQSGRENAFLMSKLLADVEALGCSFYYSYVGYCTTVCAGIHILYQNDQNTEYREQAQRCLKIERNFLERYSLVWKNGNNMLAILNRLSSQPLLILAVVSAIPEFELLDPDEILALWASIDYTTMTQEPTIASPQASLGILSPNWDRVLDVSMNVNPLSIGARTPSSAIDVGQPDRMSHYNSMMPPGTSPFSSFFHDNGMNFGA